MNMTLFSLNKKLALPFLALATLVTTTGIYAGELDSKKVDRISRDLKIMNNILKTSLSEQTKSRASIDSIYLADQGMLFTIEQRDGYHFEFHNFSVPHVQVAPTAPKAPIQLRFTEEHVEQIEEAAMIAAESAMEMAEISLDYMSDVDWSSASSAERSKHKARATELRSEKRDLELQARRLEREVRNIERRLRDSEFEEHLEQAEKDSKKSEALKLEMNKLTDSLAGVADKLKQNSSKLQKKAQEIKAKQEEKMRKRLALTETVISETVCDFGSGLRSLKDDQHMSFRIEGQPDRLYVFNKKSIMQCADGDINYAKLLENATKYTL